jgi:hypothetical protein
MQSAISDSARLDAAESLLLLAGWQPQVLRDYIYSFYTDVEGRRQESPTPFIQTTCQICSTRISLTDSTDAKCTSTPAISSLGWADSTYQPTKVSPSVEAGHICGITDRVFCPLASHHPHSRRRTILHLKHSRNPARPRQHQMCSRPVQDIRVWKLRNQVLCRQRITRHIRTRQPTERLCRRHKPVPCDPSLGHPADTRHLPPSPRGRDNDLPDRVPSPHL